MVYVDDAHIPATCGRTTANWSHMFADSEDELDTFAKALGLKPAWKQSRKPWLIHFDVTDKVRSKALKLGASPVRYRDLPKLLKRPNRKGS